MKTSGAKLAITTVTPKCPRCAQKFSEPPKNWDCPKCKVKTWQADGDVAACAVCTTAIAKYARQHCRLCGRVACVDCTTTKAVIPKWSHVTKHRICDVCAFSASDRFVAVPAVGAADGGGGAAVADAAAPATSRAASNHAHPIEDAECWICRDGHSEAVPLYDGYCHCRGTLGFAHEACIEQWVFYQNRTECPACGAAYECGEVVSETKTSSQNDHRRRRQELEFAEGASGFRQMLSWLGKLPYLSQYFFAPLLQRCLVIAIAVLLQAFVMPLIYGLAFYSGRFDPMKVLGSDATTSLMHVQGTPSARAPLQTGTPSEAAVAAAAAGLLPGGGGAPVASEMLLFSSTLFTPTTPYDPTMVLPPATTVFGALVEECAVRSSFLGLVGPTGLVVCNVVHVLLYGVIAAAFVRMVCRGWCEWSKFIVDAPLHAVGASGAGRPTYNQVQLFMVQLEKAQKWMCFAPGDTKGKVSFAKSVLLEMALVLAWTFVARSTQRLLVAGLAFLAVALVLRVVSPPNVVHDKARRFHVATGAKLTASRLQVRMWFSTYILDIVAFSIILPVIGGFVVHFGGAGYLVTPDGIPAVVGSWIERVMQGILSLTASDRAHNEQLFRDVLSSLQAAVHGLWHVAVGVLVNDAAVLAALPALPGMVELFLHWAMGTICVITLVRYESLIILPLFAPGVDFFFIRAIDLAYSDEDDSLCWSLVLTQVYDADPLRVVADLVRLVLIECSALVVFIRVPIVATFALHEVLSPASAASIQFPLSFGVMVYDVDWVGGYGDISHVATLVHFVIFGCAVTSLATFPAQRMQLQVLRPVVHFLGACMGLTDFLFDRERVLVLDEWLRNPDLDVLHMPYVPPDVMCVRRQRRLPEDSLPAMLFPRTVLFSVVFLLTSTLLSWSVVVGFASLMLFVSHATVTIVCCALALPFFFWSPRLFITGSATFLGMLGVMCVIPMVWIVDACMSVWFTRFGIHELYKQTVEWHCKIRKCVKRRQH